MMDKVELLTAGLLISEVKLYCLCRVTAELTQLLT